MGKVFDDLEAFVADLERRDVGWNELAASYHEALCKLHERDARVAALEARLELTCHSMDGAPASKVDIGDCDGIGCRDETIRMQDERIARLQSKLETRTETLRQFADAVVRAPIDCDCMDCYKERREVRGRAEKMMEALDND